MYIYFCDSIMDEESLRQMENGLYKFGFHQVSLSKKTLGF